MCLPPLLNANGVASSSPGLIAQAISPGSTSQFAAPTLKGLNQLASQTADATLSGL
ncbi:hypothetical protein PLANPX_2301 [Lacipirellula parvula]|uniref:Uncharacterized protein n=1 Tax=Lacipirellula parvula TaxID=2650471 RepID=A0A5K7XIC2_9BACT|nr:hypothetical protein PLANPX_2301 [Lacipirellula parvula]